MLNFFMVCMLLNAGSLLGYAIPEALSGNRIPSYTDHYIKTLFGAHRDQPQENREFLHELKREATNATENRPCVEEAIRSTTCEYIIRKAREIARGYTSDPKTVEAVCQKFRNDLFNIFTNGGDLNGSLRDYFGNERIKDRVWRAKEQYDQQKREEAKRSAAHAFRTYPSDECCICYTDFQHIARIFLHPCGHDLCVSCAKSLAARSAEMNCPQCRAIVTNRSVLL